MNIRKIPLLAISLALALSCSTAFADRGGKHGQGHGNQDRQEDRRDDKHDEYPDGGISIQFNFGDSQRRVINDYYAPQFRSGNCPPGLAKKGNGCMPPGQARKWSKGHSLPRDVAYYPLPRDLMLRLPAPPAGHKYVRVASDILLITIGTAMVVDAIEDIGRF